VGRSSMGAHMAVVVDDRARQRLVVARGGGRPGGVVAGRRGPEEVAAQDVDVGSGEDSGPEVRTTVGRWQDAGG
jgi:hypothetical protein